MGTSLTILQGFPINPKISKNLPLTKPHMLCFTFALPYLHLVYNYSKCLVKIIMADQFKDNIILIEDRTSLQLVLTLGESFLNKEKISRGNIKEERTKKCIWRPKTKGPLHSSHISVAIKSIPILSIWILSKKEKILSILILEFTFYILPNYFLKMPTLNYLFSKLI